jgi:hypothetical protein
VPEAIHPAVQDLNLLGFVQREGSAMGSGRARHADLVTGVVANVR